MFDQKIKTVIWDWNGTLMDDAAFCVAVMNSILKKHGLSEITLEQYKEHFQMPVRGYYDWLGIRPSDEEYDHISKVFHGLYEAGRGDCPLNDKAEQVLNRFQKNGLEQCILSAHEQRRLEETIRDYGIETFFSMIAGSDNIHGKSKTEHGRYLINELGIDPAEAVLIGDTIHDFEVAQELKTQCILISTGHYSEKRLQSTGSRVVNHLREIEDLLIN